jgi:arylsulfatase A-like enzyme
VVAGARAGATVWSAYGIAEFTVLGPLSWLALPSHLFRPMHVATVAVAAVAYPMLGFALAALACGGWARLSRTFPLFDRIPTARHRVVAILGLVSMVDASAIAALSRRPALVTVLVSAPAALAAILSRRHVGPTAAGLALGLLLTGTVWIQSEPPPSDLGPTLGAALLCLAAVAAAGAGFWRALGVRGGRPFPAVLHGALWVLLAALGPRLKPTPLIATSASALLPFQGAPSVVLITMDTVRADHLSLYGYDRPTTPELERLATVSTVYANALSAADMTLASHASLFTGRYAFAHGARPPAQPLSEKARTLAEILADRGYRTMAVVANTVYLRAVLGLAQGFQHYDQRIPARPTGGTPRGYLSNGLGRGLERWIPRAWLRPHYRQATEITDEVLRLLDATRREGGRFFLFVNFMDAHTPYFPPSPFDARFPGKDPAWDWATHRALKRQMAQGRLAVPAAARAHLVSQYDGGIAFVDAEIGRIVARLRELGLFEDSMIIVTSDHGEAFGEHGLIEHGVSVYQDQVHVPLLVKFPRSSQREVARDWVSGVDVLPTVLEVIGARPEADLQGRSLLRLPATRPLLCESFPAAGTASRAFVTAEGIKLIAGDRVPSQMYDLFADPGEETNLAPGEPARVTRLLEQMNRWIQAEAQAPPARVADPDTLEELRALGYAR